MNTHDPAIPTARKAQSLRHRLRRETRDEHETVDREFSAMMETASLPDYHRFIRVNHACHAAIEPALLNGAMSALVPQWKEWTRRPDLSRDMEEMGLEPVVTPPFAALAPQDVAGALGAAYVLEGSRLGALYIERHFARAGVAEVWPRASFHYLLSARRVGFQAFAEALDRIELAEDEACEAALSAKRAFDFFMVAVAAERNTPIGRTSVA